MITPDKIKAALSILHALAEAIRELGQVPSGQLYASVMAGMSLEDYNAALKVLIKAELVSESPAHLLTWTGPMAAK